MAGESIIRKALKARVESYGGTIRAVKWIGRNGAPDVLCLFPTAYWDTWSCGVDMRVEPHSNFVETKAPKGKPTAAQSREHDRMREAGCIVLVISTLEQLDAWLPPI